MGRAVSNLACDLASFARRLLRRCKSAVDVRGALAGIHRLTRSCAQPLGRGVLTVALLGGLILQIELDQTLAKVGSLGIGSILLVLACLWLQQILAALRWGWLLQQCGERRPIMRMAEIFFLSSAAGLLLVNSLGAMSVRAYLAHRDGCRAMPVLCSLLFEKVYTLAALLICSAAGIIVFAMRGDLHADLRLGMIFAGASMALTAAIAALMRYGSAEMLIELRSRRARRLRIATSLVALLQSLLILTLGFISVALITRALGIQAPLLLLIALQPMVALLAALPITIGGWGLREGGMVLGMGLLGVASPDALAVSVLYGALCALAALSVAGVAALASRDRTALIGQAQPARLALSAPHSWRAGGA